MDNNQSIFNPLLEHIRISDHTYQLEILKNFDKSIDDKIKQDVGVTKYTVKDNHLYYNCFGSCTDNSNEFTLFLKEALDSNTLENTTFYVFTKKSLTAPFYAANTNNLRYIRDIPAFMFNRDTQKTLESNKFLLPDPFLTGKNLIGVADLWEDLLDKIQEKSSKVQFEDKISKIFWRGAKHMPSTDEVNINMEENNKNHSIHFPRIDLVDLSKDYGEILNAKFSYNFLEERKNILLSYEEKGQNPADFYAIGASPAFHVNFKYLISLDGSDAAWIRVPFILSSNSLLIKDISTKEQWFYPLLKDKETCVMVSTYNLKNLINLYDWLEYNPNTAKNIIKNANHLSENYFSTEAMEHYTIAAIEKYTLLIGRGYYNYSSFLDLSTSSGEIKIKDKVYGKKGGDVFKYMDLPIIENFLVKHNVIIDHILFDLDFGIYKMLNDQSIVGMVKDKNYDSNIASLILNLLNIDLEKDNYCDNIKSKTELIVNSCSKLYDIFGISIQEPSKDIKDKVLSEFINDFFYESSKFFKITNKIDLNNHFKELYSDLKTLSGYVGIKLTESAELFEHINPPYIEDDANPTLSVDMVHNSVEDL